MDQQGPETRETLCTVKGCDRDAWYLDWPKPICHEHYAELRDGMVAVVGESHTVALLGEPCPRCGRYLDFPCPCAPEDTEDQPDTGGGMRWRIVRAGGEWHRFHDHHGFSHSHGPEPLYDHGVDHGPEVPPDQPATAIARADRKLRAEVEEITDPKLRDEIRRAL